MVNKTLNTVTEKRVMLGESILRLSWQLELKRRSKIADEDI